jgi:hypothetical protein
MDARERLAARLPASFQKGRTAEAKAAYESGSLEEWEALLPKLRAEVQKVRAKIPAFNKPVGPDGLTSRSLGEPAQLPAASFLKGTAPRPRQTTGDADRDALPETLEEGLWQAFVPRYFISAAEPNRFARFGSGPQAIVTSTQAAPVGYYRVHPLFLGTKSGVTYGFAQITYATFWDRDNGLVVSPRCRRQLALALGLIGVNVGEMLSALHLTGHELDYEHSAALVAAPLAGTVFNPDPAPYRMYMFYTAAHEGTFTDQSDYYFVKPPASPGAHVPLYLSQAKHATYVFDPEGYPVAPGWIIDAFYWTLQILSDAGEVPQRQLQVVAHIGDIAFFHCFVEHFQKQGDGVSPSPAINVGAPGHPLNGAAWAETAKFKEKLSPRWNERVLRSLGFRYAGPPPGGDSDPDPDPDPPDPPDPRDRDPRDRDPIPR